MSDALSATLGDMRYSALLIIILAGLALLWFMREQPRPLALPTPPPTQIPDPADFTWSAKPDFLEHQVLNRHRVGGEISLNVLVALVDDRLPTADELEAVAEYLISAEERYDRSTVSFFLPGMTTSPYATVSRSPELLTQLMPENLPEDYRRLAEGRESGNDLVP